EVPGQRDLDLLALRAFVSLEQCGGGDDDSGRADAALDGAPRDELPDEATPARGDGDSLDRLDDGAGALRCEDEARIAGGAGEQDGACAAIAGAAAELRPGELEVVAEHVDQQPVSPTGERPLGPVAGERVRHARTPSRSPGPRARGVPGADGHGCRG